MTRGTQQLEEWEEKVLADWNQYPRLNRRTLPVDLLKWADEMLVPVLPDSR